VEFSSAVDALSAAIEFQQATADANRDEPIDNAMVFRFGLHIGDLIVEGDDLYGDGVNVAARLEAEAPAGGIVISRTAHEAVAGRLKATFDDLGSLSLKNIERPIQAFSVKWQPTDWLRPRTPTGPSLQTMPPPASLLPSPDKPSIAVLPFQNMSGDPEQDYFADGIVEDMITALSRFKSLFVIARNSSFTYKRRAVDIKQVGHELGVSYVLEGSVRKIGNRVRITGQLIEAATSAHIWADKFDASVEDLFEVQDKVTVSVVDAIAPTLERVEIDRARTKPPDRLDAYDLVLQGTALMRRRATLEKAYDLFKEAIKRDPGYALAYASAAYISQWAQAVRGLPISGERREEAIRFSGMAVKMAPDDAFVLARAGHNLAYFRHDFDRALALVDDAVALNPNCAPAWFSRGWVSIICAEPEKAIESFTQMVRLSPLDPLSANSWYGGRLRTCS
jgi:adenylate cyclase